MRLVTYRPSPGQAPRVGVLDGDRVAGLEASDMVELIAAGPGEARRAARSARDAAPLADVKLLAPVPLPRKIIAIGLNYRDHATETGAAIPDKPIVFAKYPNTVCAPGDPIRIPPITRKADYEAELGVVIGSPAKEVDEASALDHVFGYLNVHDVSARDLQFSEGGQRTRSKSLDTFAPMGPYLVTADEMPDPQALGIRCLLNGEVVQDSNTREMIFPVASLIAFLSQGMTLWPGDVIATGTPAGVGTARKPPVYLKPGDEVIVEVEGLGSLTNPVE